MSTEIMTIDFHGDTLEATQTPDGKIWVSLRRCCENLGLALQRQLEKLKGKAWAVITEMVMTGPDGKQYAMTCVDLDTLPGWLFSVDARKVKEAVREKLARYQREAARVLADHFYSRMVQIPVDQLESFAADLTHRVLDLITPELRGLIGDMRGPQRERMWSIKDRCEFLGWYSAKPRQRDKVRHQMLVRLNRDGFPRPIAEGTSPAAELLFPESQMGILDRVILSIWDDARRVENGGPMFGDA